MSTGLHVGKYTNEIIRASKTFKATGSILRNQYSTVEHISKARLTIPPLGKVNIWNMLTDKYVNPNTKMYNTALRLKYFPNKPLINTNTVTKMKLIPKELENTTPQCPSKTTNRQSFLFKTNSCKAESAPSRFKSILSTRSADLRVFKLKTFAPLRSKPLEKKYPCEATNPCKPKNNPCAPKPKPCKPKADPCKPKSDPCKPKSDPCKPKDDPCKPKTNPCKPKSDPCKPKSNPCGSKESAKPAEPCMPLKKPDPCK